MEKNEWNTDLQLYIENMALKCYQRQLMHGYEADKCNRYEWWITRIVDLLGALSILCQIFTIFSKDKKTMIIWAIVTICINAFSMLITEWGHSSQYGSQESDHIKVSADYELIYQNILVTISHPFDKRRAGNEYSIYINNTYIRIKTNGPLIPLKIQEKYEKHMLRVLTLHSSVMIDIAPEKDGDSKSDSVHSIHNEAILSGNVREHRLKTMESKRVITEIENRMKKRGLSASAEYEMHRLFHNL